MPYQMKEFVILWALINQYVRVDFFLSDSIIRLLNKMLICYVTYM